MKTKTKPKHTPGPWTLEGLKIFDTSNTEERCVVATVHGFHEGEDLSNAALIAAAPDMLEALELIKYRFESFDPIGRFETTHPLIEALLLAGDAIRKAKGKTV